MAYKGISLGSLDHKKGAYLNEEIRKLYNLVKIMSNWQTDQNQQTDIRDIIIKVPSNQPTNWKTDLRVHRKVTLPIMYKRSPNKVGNKISVAYLQTHVRLISTLFKVVLIEQHFLEAVYFYIFFFFLKFFDFELGILPFSPWHFISRKWINQLIWKKMFFEKIFFNYWEYNFQ